ncbi:alpha-glucosidase [Bowdeniella nasicola]|uniref:Alpha-glucosidase n=1 Tax=Bowdeniella nasicola TaxID=208480 RepID=A0A1H3W7B6_9ACTO|nr:glycoside hydrolase family 13 protein [Bowdeniella nasicola]SDZ82178.1 alpha-glucosidase [Bowdeniella nasicola]
MSEPAATYPWWHSAVIYQIYPRSFASSKGPIGTLAGVTKNLDYLRDLGIDAIWLSPFYRSPQHDAGYDVADYFDVDPRFGTLADADEMIQAAHERGLKVIIDLVPNHTSEDHEWFQAALAAGPGSPERERYYFRDEPNNWLSIFGGSAWTRVKDRADAPGSSYADDEQYYLHLFDSSQPDLNWDNPEVADLFDRILRFWLERGVDGFRIDVAHGLVKDPALPDYAGHVQMVQGDDGERPPMFDQDGVHEIYRRWNKVLAEYDGDRMLVAEAWVDPPERLARYVRDGEMHQAFNFDYLVAPWDARELRAVAEQVMATFAAVGAPTTWVLSNHDVVRHASRLGLRETGKGPNGIFATDPQPDRELGLRRARAATALMLALPGSAYLYQGEELGLPEHTSLPDKVREDPAFFRTNGLEAGRDGCRVPLPWRAHEPGYGFSPSGETWLPQPEDWDIYAVDTQLSDPTSTLYLYRALLHLRKAWQLGEADFVFLPDVPEHVVAGVARTQTGAEYLVFTAIGKAAPLPAGWQIELATDDLTESGEVPADVTVWASRA